MTKEVQIFKNEEFGSIRTLIIDNNIWFIASEVAELLGYSNPQKAVRNHVDVEDRNTRTICSGIRGNPNKVIINESGLYSLILSSKLPTAKKFKHWITSEVLPTIRKSGGYINNDELFINTYLPNADEQTKMMFKTQLSAIKDLNSKVGKLQEENTKLNSLNNILIEDTQEWEYSKIINALIRKYASECCNNNFQIAWNTYYKALRYKYSIDMWKRKNKKNSNSVFDVLSDGELKKAVKIAVALCKKNDIDVISTINEVNYNLIKDF